MNSEHFEKSNNLSFRVVYSLFTPVNDPIQLLVMEVGNVI